MLPAEECTIPRMERADFTYLGSVDDAAQHGRDGGERESRVAGVARRPRVPAARRNQATGRNLRQAYSATVPLRVKNLIPSRFQRYHKEKSVIASLVEGARNDNAVALRTGGNMGAYPYTRSSKRMSRGVTGRLKIMPSSEVQRLSAT